MRGSGAGLLIAVLLSATATAESAEELIAKNLQARGGLAKIKSVQSMRLTGTMSVGDDRMPSVLELKRPNKTRWEFTFDGQTAIQAFDGKSGWMVMPFEGKAEPAPMPAEELKDIELQADMDGPLVDYQEKGTKVELEGHDTAILPEAWKLKVTLRDGEVRYVYLDPKSYLQVMTVTARNLDGDRVEIRNAIGDYREVGGILLPHAFEATAEGEPLSQSLKFDKIELNVPIDDGRFRMPQSKKPAQKDEPPPPPEVG